MVQCLKCIVCNGLHGYACCSSSISVVTNSISDNVHLYHFTLFTIYTTAFPQHCKMYEHLSLFHLIIQCVYFITEHHVKQTKKACLSFVQRIECDCIYSAMLDFIKSKKLKSVSLSACAKIIRPLVASCAESIAAIGFSQQLNFCGSNKIHPVSFVPKIFKAQMKEMRETKK